MNLATFERAKLADFCFREARHTGSLDTMKAIAYVLRNRLKAGWGDGTWLRLMESAAVHAGNDYHNGVEFDASDRLLQMLVRDIDDIAMGISQDDVRRVVEGTAAPEGTGSAANPRPALYYQFVDLPPREWFVTNIVREQASHPRVAQVGPLMLYR